MNAPLHLSPFRRDGHLSEPGLEAIGVGLIAVDDEALASHLASCGSCRTRLDAHLLDVASTTLPPPPAFLRAPVQVEATPANRPWPALAGLVVAAAALFMVLPSATPPPSDGLRLKGNPLQLEVFADEGSWSRRLGADDEVKPTDRLGFRVGSSHDGYVLIMGIDQDASPYLCYPQDDSAARWHEAGPSADLEEAIRLDGSSGSERLIGLLCPEPVDFEDLKDRLVDAAHTTAPDGLLPDLMHGCDQQEVRLAKRRRP